MNPAKLKTELESGHPGTGAYSPDDATAAEQINALNRTGSVIGTLIVTAAATLISLFAVFGMQ